MDRLVGRPVNKQKVRFYVFSTAVSKKISLQKFKRKGKKIRLKEEEVLRMPQLNRVDHTFGSINAADLVGKNSKQLFVGAKQELFLYDFKANNTVLHVKKHHFGKICNVKCWRDYVIFCTGDGPVRIMHLLDRRQKPFVLDQEFAADYFGGYNAFSRNAEVDGNFLIYVSKKGMPVVFDLSTILDAKPEMLTTPLEFGSEIIGQTEGTKFFTKLPARVVNISGIDSLSIFQKYAYFASMDGTVHGVTKKLDSFGPKEEIKTKRFVRFEGNGLELTAVEFYHGNIIAVMFDLSSRKACLKLLNLKTSIQSEAAISQQDRPTQKILMFVKRKMCFGIALNRGVDMHVFGIHRCNIILFSQNINLGATHICGILFLDGKLTSSKLLVYGQDNYNQVFRVTL